MHEVSKVLYCPALRLKAGELAGVRELDDGVARHVLPRFIVPPAADRGDTPQHRLFDSDYCVPDVGGLLSGHWLGRRAFIDFSYLIPECGAAQSEEWLPPIFARAKSLHVRAIPFVRTDKLGPELIAAVKSVLPADEALKLGISVRSGDLEDPQLGETLRTFLSELSLEFRECAVFADFTDADFSEFKLVSPIIGFALEALQDLGPWQLIVFQGTHYPEKNPVTQAGQTVAWPRNEWHAWHDAVKFDANTAEHLIFGDYAADCAKMNFKKAGTQAIRHYRYATPTDWLIVRGDKGGGDPRIMADVCRRVVNSGQFAGPDFSLADRYIYDNATGGTNPGNPQIWRQVNTTHHITQVVADVAKVREIRIAPLPSEPAILQATLFVSGE
ncbi:TPA: beta family protein [Burkholderia vietnamiensis]|uniref:beta family protein n=1 Tax=Burkholderia vietnamiensis TaxID=60552 RepID=UPI00158CED40|nr:beta family protein [Burkholderia vietnamiensis]HDR9025549.1 beta family protein [Burkholderia vietnamiensis]